LSKVVNVFNTGSKKSIDFVYICINVDGTTSFTVENWL